MAFLPGPPLSASARTAPALLRSSAGLEWSRAAGAGLGRRRETRRTPEPLPSLPPNYASAESPASRRHRKLGSQSGEGAGFGAGRREPGRSSPGTGRASCREAGAAQPASLRHPPPPSPREWSLEQRFPGYLGRRAGVTWALQGTGAELTSQEIAGWKGAQPRERETPEGFRGLTTTLPPFTSRPWRDTHFLGPRRSLTVGVLRTPLSSSLRPHLMSAPGRRDTGGGGILPGASKRLPLPSPVLPAPPPASSRVLQGIRLLCLSLKLSLPSFQGGQL